MIGILSLDLLWILLNSEVAGSRWELVMVLDVATLVGIRAGMAVQELPVEAFVVHHMLGCRTVVDVNTALRHHLLISGRLRIGV